MYIHKYLWPAFLNVAVYRPYCENQKREMERIQEEEGLTLPPDIDYLSLPVSLSDEVREVLDRARPDTVSVDMFKNLHDNHLYWFSPRLTV